MSGWIAAPFAAALALWAGVRDDTDSCCAALTRTSLQPHILFPDQTAFRTNLDSYFDIKQQSLIPKCVVQPRNADDVSIAVRTLVSMPEPCRFAIRSGGQTPYVGASNIKDGVTIDLRYISAVQYDANSSLVEVGPGARWIDVFTALEPYGVMTTGGRASTVGVGGSTLGGGISYFTPEHGLICDNVMEFEVVLADGRIVTASKTRNPDLFTVLKGGNNNFGIVTQFKFRTFKYDGMWGGLVLYPETAVQDHFKALIDFTDNVDENPKSAVIVMPVYQSKVDAHMILNAYDHTEPVARPAAYSDFLAIPGNLSDTTAMTNMSTLAAALAAQTGSSVYFGTLTFANDLRVVTAAHQIYLDVVDKLKAKATGEWQIYILYQPLTPAFWRDSASRGGNVLGLERFNGQNLCLYQPYISWQGAAQDELFQQAGAELISRVRAFAESIGADNPYLYLDYADVTQDALAGYGAESIAKMRAAAEKYDPQGVFQRLVPGGFKISKVAS